MRRSLVLAETIVPAGMRTVRFVWLVKTTLPRASSTSDQPLPVVRTLPVSSTLVSTRRAGSSPRSKSASSSWGSAVSSTVASSARCPGTSETVAAGRTK